MTRVSRILFCTDFSKNSEIALKYCVALCKDIGASLTVMHAYRLLQPVEVNGDGSPFSIKDQWEKASWDQLKVLEEKYLKSTKLKYEFDIGVGFATDTILSSVQSNNYDLLVLGKNGKGSFGSMFGSTTEFLIEKANIPLLIVPADAVYGAGLHSGIFAIDFNHPPTNSRFKPIIGMLKYLKVKFKVLNVNTTHENVGPNGSANIIDDFMEGLKYDFDIVYGTDIESTILNYLDENEVDVLVAMHNPRNFVSKVFNRSITKRLSAHSNVPIITFQG